ncbi:MAG: DUF6056 family protein [Bacteroidota bacterium]
MKRKDILQNLLYGILLSVFLLLYFILSMNSRLVADDFYFLKNLQDYGWWQSMVVSWHSWVTRWASILWLNGILNLYRFTGNFLFFQIITLLVMCFALFRLSTFSIDFWLRYQKESPELSPIADIPRHSRFTIALIISFFFTVGDIGETFFWVTSSAMYLWGFIAFCFLLAEVMRGRQTASSFIVCLLTAAFAGGAAEVIAIPTLVMLVIIFVVQVLKKDLRPITITSILAIILSVLISYSGEGRELRLSALPHISLQDSVLLTFKSIAQFEFHFLKAKLLWLPLFYFAWMGFGASISQRINFKLKYLLWIIGCYLLVFFIIVFPACYLLGEAPPLRATILPGFINCCLISFCGILTGVLIRQSLITKIISSLALMLLIFMTGKMAIEQIKITGTYTNALDIRMKFLTTLADPEDTVTIIMDPLPSSGFLPTSEISTDPADFKNQHLKKFLGLKADLKVK